jgi:hypothetical protein
VNALAGACENTSPTMSIVCSHRASQDAVVGWSSPKAWDGRGQRLRATESSVQLLGITAGITGHIVVGHWVGRSSAFIQAEERDNYFVCAIEIFRLDSPQPGEQNGERSGHASRQG